MNSPRPNGLGFKFFNSLLGSFQIISKRQNSCFYEIKTPCVSCRKLFALLGLTGREPEQSVLT